MEVLRTGSLVAALASLVLTPAAGVPLDGGEGPAARLNARHLTGGPAAAMPGLSDEETFQRVILGAYAKLATYARSAPSDLHFELGDSFTLYSEDFDTAQWVDLITMPGGQAIDVLRSGTRIATERGTRVQVTYKPTWKVQEAGWLLSGRSKELLTFSVRELLEALSREGDFGSTEVRALTSFEVEALLDGRQRTYRAAFAWIWEGDPPRRDLLGFLVLDNVTQGLDSAVREEIPVDGVWTPASLRSWTSPPAFRGPHG